MSKKGNNERNDTNKGAEIDEEKLWHFAIVSLCSFER